MQFSSDRTFRLWDYNVSHKQMLLRSPKSLEVAMNVDIVLWGVEYLDLATSLQGLMITTPTREDVTRAGRALGSTVDASQVHCFSSEDRRFVVVASGYKVLRNDLDIFESSLEYFAGTDPSRNVGEVLAYS